MRCVLLCGGPVYEGISGPTEHLHSDRSLHVAIHFVIVVLRIRICANGSTPILILCFRFVVAFAFVICIRIAHKWNLSLRPTADGDWILCVCVCVCGYVCARVCMSVCVRR